MNKILKAIAVTAELMQKEISPAAAAVLAEDLREYPQELVIQALTNLRKVGGRFTLDAILSQIEKLQPDGRPGSDEAWAMIPKDEYASAVISNEMAEALGIAQPLINDGDKIAARMAFKEAYTRIVEANKLHGIKPAWFPSLGHDIESREAALADAVRPGRITAGHAIGLLPPEKIAPMLQSAGESTLALGYKIPDFEVSMERFKNLKLALKGQK